MYAIGNIHQTKLTWPLNFGMASSSFIISLNSVTCSFLIVMWRQQQHGRCNYVMSFPTQLLHDSSHLMHTPLGSSVITLHSSNAATPSTITTDIHSTTTLRQFFSESFSVPPAHCLFHAPPFSIRVVFPSYVCLHQFPEFPVSFPFRPRRLLPTLLTSLLPFIIPLSSSLHDPSYPSQ